MSRFAKAAFLTFALAAATDAAAVPLGQSKSPWAPEKSLYLSEGEAALAPLAHIKFCMTSPEDCAASPGQASLGEDAFPMLDRVNRDINQRIRPSVKTALIGNWAVNPEAGDCNDYAVSKRHELIKQGLPANALRLAVAKTSWGEGHLVLIARTTSGDYVLDNLSDRVKPWSETSHRFLSVQSSDDARQWVSVTGRHPIFPVRFASYRARNTSQASSQDWFIP